MVIAEMEQKKEEKNAQKEPTLEERTETIWEKYSWKALIRVHDLYLERRCCAKLYDSMLNTLEKRGVLTKEPMNKYGIFTIVDMVANPRNSKGEIFYFNYRKDAESYNARRHKTLRSMHKIEKITRDMFTLEGKPLYL